MLLCLSRDKCKETCESYDKQWEDWGSKDCESESCFTTEWRVIASNEIILWEKSCVHN